jgi:hypothetical protein
MAKKNKKIEVQGSEITIITSEEQDYISLKIPSNFWASGKKFTIRILIPPNSRELKIRPD